MARAGYPVHVWSSHKTLDGPALHWFVDGGMAGRCGHEHKTEAAAKKCVEPMTRKWREMRWPKKKAV